MFGLFSRRKALPVQEIILLDVYVGTTHCIVAVQLDASMQEAQVSIFLNDSVDRNKAEVENPIAVVKALSRWAKTETFASVPWGYKLVSYPYKDDGLDRTSFYRKYGWVPDGAADRLTLPR